ncbi:DUF6912 family protein [Acidipropionibacterium virtanenii]|uniref:Uncharacterized protein n=1 Tax=Acidipropionibacterium virtanenii TaxID=2057246 RepID=A0A344UTM9_9ACTN|nr:hypothetical protein [Acidipropionibacterium virtanenii]AXE38627.1 hypothetical protein JS278_01460 [Acidipropionibacterium virtanenii]
MPARTSHSTGADRLVFIPADASGARKLVEDGGSDVQGFAVTPELRSILDLGAGGEEEAERAAMVIGSIWGLARFGRRLVLVAHLPEAELGENYEVDNGGVSIARLQPSRITAWFADEDDRVSEPAAGQIAGMVIDDAWNDVSVQSLLAEHEMSWHDITEQLPAPGTDPVRS